MKKKKEENTVNVTLVFDNKDAAENFMAYWLDGGGDGGGTISWYTNYIESSKWDKGDYSKVRIKGTGDFI